MVSIFTLVDLSWNCSAVVSVVSAWIKKMEETVNGKEIFC